MSLANAMCEKLLGMLADFTNLNAIGSKSYMDKSRRAFRHHESFQHQISHDASGLRDVEDLSWHGHKKMAVHCIFTSSNTLLDSPQST
jgi:hypothetical protein